MEPHPSQQARTTDGGYGAAVTTKETDDEAPDHSDAPSVNDLLDRVGFGCFHVKLGILCGLLWMAEPIELGLIRLLVPSLLCDWRMKQLEAGLLTMLTSAGALLGSILFGYLGDKLGRKPAIALSAAGIAYFGLLSVFAPRMPWFLVLRFLVGVGTGGSALPVLFFIEFGAHSQRGKALFVVAALEFLRPLIDVLMESIAAPLLGRFGWYSVVFVTSFSQLIILVLFATCAWESPRYLAVTGDLQKLKDLLSHMGKVNKRPLPENFNVKVYPDDPANRGRTHDLFVKGFLLVTLLQFVIWFSSSLANYTMVAVSPLIFNNVTACSKNMSQPQHEDAAQGREYCHLDVCIQLTQASNSRTSLMWTVIIDIAEILAVVVAALIMHLCGRKHTCAIMFSVGLVSSALLFICVPNAGLTQTLLLVSRGAFFSVTWCIYLYTIEVYPTTIRSIGLGYAYAISRIAPTIKPPLSDALTTTWIGVSLTTAILLGLLGLVCCVLLPIETRDHALNDVVKKTEREKAPPCVGCDFLKIKHQNSVPRHT